MRRLIAFAAVLVCAVYGHAQIQTPAVVRQFYRGIVSMSSCDKQILSQLELDMKQCFCGHEDSGINLPNDFRFFDWDKNSVSHNLDILTSNNYINKLSQYAYEEKVLQSNIELSSSSRKVGELPEFGKKSMTTSGAYVETVVRKKYTFRSGGKEQSREFSDTVYTHIAMNKIRAIYNGAGTTAVEDLDRLRIEAARAYGEKRYSDAYTIFKKISETDKGDSETFYRLGLMTFYGKGCRKNRKAGKQLMETASRLGYHFGYKAGIVLRHWFIPNSL